MIQKLSFTNYKAFEKGEIKLKPITILLGANSVGKSSILQLLLMLQQTALSKNYKSSLRLHGENLSMGENDNIFKDRNTGNNIKLEFEFKDQELTKLLKNGLIEEFTLRLLRPITYMGHLRKKTEKFNEQEYLYKFIDKKTGSLKKDIWDSKNDFLKLIDESDALLTQINLKIKNDKNSDLFSQKVLSLTDDIEEISQANTVETIFDFLNEIRKIKSSVFSLLFEIQNIKSRGEDVLKLINISLLQENKVILDVNLPINKPKNGYESVQVNSDFIKNIFLEDKDKEELLQAINYDSALFSCISPNVKQKRDFFSISDVENSSISKIIIQILYQAIDNVKASFSKEGINYVSPIRAHPKRYYFLDKANINTSLDTLDGDSLTEILKENRVVKTKVNKWLNNFNLSVDVSTLQDVIHKLKVKQNGLDLDITDVGFGISQILPVIVQGFMSFNNSLTIIEQPEIHLHPKMQADLADLFIDIVNTNKKTNKYLLIETHSEYLLKRLRRRISENKTISADDVAIYFINPKSVEINTGIIEEKKISSEGSFEWPKDFYEGELLLDAVEFIKNQSY